MSIYLIVKNEIRRIIKSKKKFFITIFIPVIAVIFAMGVNTIMKPSISLGIIDKGNSQIKDSFVDKANHIDGIKIREADEDTINTDMIMAKYMAVIEFNANNQIKLYCMDNELKETIEEIINNFINTSKLDGLQELLIKLEKESMTVTERSVGFILLSLIVTCVLTSCNIIKDKEEGTLKRYGLTPNIKSYYILGNYIFNFILTSLQIIIASLIIGILNLKIGINLSEFLLIGIIIAFIASSISALIVSIVNTELKASLMASGFGLIISLIGGAFLPLEKMPEGIKLLSNFSITKWVIEFTKAMETNSYELKNYMPIIIVMLMSAMFIGVSIILGNRKFD